MIAFVIDFWQFSKRGFFLQAFGSDLQAAQHVMIECLEPNWFSISEGE